MADAPTGTITFLFTDVEGSTRLWQEHPEGMREALARHDQILRDAIESNNGYVFSTGGDSYATAFADPLDAMRAALDAQHALSLAEWGDVGRLKVRMALDTGLAEHRDGDYFGPPLNRVARIEEVADGGHILLSNTTADLVRYSLPDGLELAPMGEQKLRDVERPVEVFQLQPEFLVPGRRGLLLGGLAASGAVLAIVLIAAVVLATRSPSASQPDSPAATDTDVTVMSPAWSAPLGSPGTAPFVAHGAVYTASSEDDSTTLVAFDSSDGSQRWSFEAEGRLKGGILSDGRALYLLSAPVPGSHPSVDKVWVIDPADGALVRGCGLSLPTADMSIAVTSHAVYALSATGIVYLVPTDSDGTGRCHAFATENRTFALAPPMESGPVAAGSALILGDSQRVYQLDADDLGEDGSYFPASGQPAEYRGEPIAVAVDSMQIQTPTAIEETLPVYTVDGEGLVHSSSNGVRAMAPTEIGASRAPLVDSSGVIIIAEDGTVIAYSHDLDDERWQTRIGSVRHAGLDEGILYLTDEVGVVVLDAASGRELWALETDAAAAAGGGGRVFVVTTSGELEAYEIGDSASDPVAVQPAARRQIEEPVVVAERLLAAFNAGDVAGVMARYAADAELDEVHLMEEENWRDLSDHVSSLAIFGWQIEPRNCAVGEERGPGLVVTCDAVAFDPVDEILGITADGVIDLVIADGLVRRTLGEQDELWWLTNLGFIYTPTPGYTEAIDAWLEWAEVRYGEGWDAVCDSDSEDIFETDRLCAAVGEEAAREYIAETGG